MAFPSKTSGGAAAKARNRGKAALAVGPPPYGGPKGKGGIPTPRGGSPAKKAPITGPMEGFRGRDPLDRRSARSGPRLNRS
jgi:hypothetical protein